MVRSASRQATIACVVIFASTISTISTIAAASIVHLYISPSGSDNNDGSLEQPFQSIRRAQAEVRTLKAAASTTAPPAITVFLREGRYELDATLEFTVEDSGFSSEARVTYEAYCDAEVEAAMRTELAYPYSSHLTVPPRSLWNGVGDSSQWHGPIDPFLALGINRSSNAVLTAPSDADDSTELAGPSVCVDTVQAGHTCYTGVVADCVAGCQVACLRHEEMPEYSSTLKAAFSHLFGKELARQEDCVERCSVACRGCEKVTLSGSTRIPPGAITSWALDHTVEAIVDGELTPRLLPVFTADLSPFLPTLDFSPPHHQPGTMEISQQQALLAANPTVISSLFVDNVQLPRAGYPNCRVVNEEGVQTEDTGLRCGYSTPVVSDTPGVVRVDADTFTPRLSEWQAPAAVSVMQLQLCRTAPLSLRATGNSHASTSEASGCVRYGVGNVDAAEGTFILRAGGSQQSRAIFTHGLNLSSPSNASAAGVRIDNVLAELDSPGEWFFDAPSRRLYLIPLAARDARAPVTVAAMNQLTLELPRLRQLIRIRGSRANDVTLPTHASHTQRETFSNQSVSHLAFRQLTLSGTMPLLTTDVFERLEEEPADGDDDDHDEDEDENADWPVARIAAVFMETVADIVVEQCTFDKIGAHAVLLSGHTQGVTLRHNNISFIGGTGIALLARRYVRHNAHQQAVLAQLLHSQHTTIQDNQLHHFGRHDAQAAGILLLAASQTAVAWNLLFAYPRVDARGYRTVNARGASSAGPVYESDLPERPMAPLLFRSIAAISIPTTREAEKDTWYEVQVPLAGFDVPIVALLVGSPECPSGSGRVSVGHSELYGENHPAFQLEMCSSCCSLHSNGAQLRVVRGSGETPTPWPSLTEAANNVMRTAVIHPGDSLELRVLSSPAFNAVVDVYLGFQVVTPNQVFSLPTRARWRVVTRACRYSESRYRVACHGPCSAAAFQGASGCGNSNLDAQKLLCADGYEREAESLECHGPFDAWADCEGSGVAASHLYYNCSVACFTTACT